MTNQDNSSAKIKVLNLYAGIGGNRKLWDTLGMKLEITAVEIDTKIAKIYQDFFPNDKVIVADAHQFLLEHFKEFDFIWASPPCPSHSRLRRFLCVENKGVKPIYPDMKLYEEIIFLQSHCKTKWVIENVKSYYKPLITPFELERHYFWANFVLTDNNKEKVTDIIRNTKGTAVKFNFDLTKYVINDKQKLIKNCVNPKVGLHIFRMAFKDRQMSLNHLKNSEAMEK